MTSWAFAAPFRLSLTGTVGLTADFESGAPAPTTATLSGSSSAIENVAATYTVTLNAAADQTYTITPSASDSGSLSAASFTITAGNTSGSVDVTWPVAGAGRTVDFTISPSLTRSGRPLTVAVVDFSWAFSDASTLNLAANTTTILATGVPSGATAEVSPDLPPGLTLQITGTDLEVVGDSTVPTIDGSSSGSVMDLASGIDHTFEVLTSPLATLRNATKSIDYTASSGNWNTMMAAADHGDQIQISPGFVHASQADMSNYFSNSLDGCMLAVFKAISISRMAGRGRWSIYGSDDLMTETPVRNAGGIYVFSPEDIGGTRTVPIVIEGFQFDNWCQTAAAQGVKVRQNSVTLTDTWADFHESVTFRDFKIGKRPYYRSASGFSGAAETLLIEDGHVYDCGGGIAGTDGNDHNFYITAKTLTMRGVRSERSRGNEATGWWDGGSDMDGHHLKVSANDILIEGCCLDSDPVWGDNSAHIQAKAGGNLVVRGCLLVGSLNTQDADKGFVIMNREWNAAGTAENFETWAAGATGNSVLIEKNVFVSHYGKPLVWFFPVGAANTGYMASGSGVDEIASVTVRDNIGMCAATPTHYGPFDQSKWIMNDPTGGADWTTRGNAVETYSLGETAFSNRLIKAYTRQAGTLAAGAGSVTTKRFIYPHGYATRTDAYKGLA